MPAPTNTSSGTAIVIGAFPYTDTVLQTDWSLAAGVPLWWKYVGQPGDIAVGMRVTCSANPGAVAPVLDILTNPVGSPLTEAGINGSGNFLPAQSNIANGTTYYFRITITGALSGSGTVGLDLVPALSGTAAVGSLVIPDDQIGFPTQLIDTTTGQVVRVVSLPSTENQAALADGTIMIGVKTAAGVFPNLALYHADLTFIGNVANPDGTTNQQLIAASRTGTPIFVVGAVGSGAGVRNLYVLSAAGAITATWPLPIDGAGQHSLQSVAVSPDGSYAYWFPQDTTPGVHRMNLTTGADTVLVASDPLAQPEEVITLADGSFVVAFSKSFGTVWILRRFNAAGVQQGSDYAVDLAYNYDHMQPWTNDPTSIVVWLQDQAGPNTSRFLFLNVADWSTAHASFDLTIWENGKARLTTTARFGPSNSCPLFLTTVQIGTPTPVITSVTSPPCGDGTVLQTITITGTNFPVPPTVTFTDPNAGTLAGTVVSATSTTIVVQVIVAVCGSWSVVVGTSASFPFSTGQVQPPFVPGTKQWKLERFDLTPRGEQSS